MNMLETEEFINITYTARALLNYLHFYKVDRDLNRRENKLGHKFYGVERQNSFQ